jgi:hypothetical protein
METWNGGKWNLYRHKYDHFVGVENLIAAYQKHRKYSHVLRYEDLLTDPEGEVRRLLEYLELEFDPSVLSRFAKVELKGKITDVAGMQRYQALSREPLEKWKRTLSNPLRKRWAANYLRWLGKERLAVMGYDLDTLLQELKAVPTSGRFFGSDLMLMPAGVFYTLVDIDMVMDKIGARRTWHRINLHS